MNSQAVCSCLPGFLGNPPTCHPECIVDSDCPMTAACSNQKCRNPCVGTCGINALCNVNNHHPLCRCQPAYTGDPFTRCYEIRKLSLFQTNTLSNDRGGCFDHKNSNFENQLLLLPNHRLIRVYHLRVDRMPNAKFTETRNLAPAYHHLSVCHQTVNQNVLPTANVPRI